MTAIDSRVGEQIICISSCEFFFDGKKYLTRRRPSQNLVSWCLNFGLLDISHTITLSDLTGTPCLELEEGINTVDDHRDESKELNRFETTTNSFINFICNIDYVKLVVVTEAAAQASKVLPIAAQAEAAVNIKKHHRPQ